jgi:hypothetical protein
VRRGSVDLAFVPVRAWSGLDVHSFDALIAPLVVDSHALEREVLATVVWLVRGHLADVGWVIGQCSAEW